MRSFYPALLFLFLIPLGTWAAEISPPFQSVHSVTATIINTKNEPIGKAVFTETVRGVQIELTVEKLPPGKHGLHIHENGICTPPDFKSAGEHYNPNGQAHGFNHLGGPHAGDLPNLIVGKDGKAHVELFDPNVILNLGSNALLKQGGTSLVIHAGKDDEISQPSGNSGKRIACAVIELPK